MNFFKQRIFTISVFFFFSSLFSFETHNLCQTVDCYYQQQQAPVMEYTAPPAKVPRLECDDSMQALYLNMNQQRCNIGSAAGFELLEQQGTHPSVPYSTISIEEPKSENYEQLLANARAVIMNMSNTIRFMSSKMAQVCFGWIFPFILLQSNFYFCC
jgi:hypothetical protein